MKSVPQEILKKAKHCPYDFACLKDPKHKQGIKIYMGASDLVKIIPKAGANVTDNPYLIEFKYSQEYYCNCPVFYYLNR